MICSKGTGRNDVPDSNTEAERSGLPLKRYFIVTRRNVSLHLGTSHYSSTDEWFHFFLEHKPTLNHPKWVSVTGPQIWKDLKSPPKNSKCISLWTNENTTKALEPVGLS